VEQGEIPVRSVEAGSARSRTVWQVMATAGQARYGLLRYGDGAVAGVRMAGEAFGPEGPVIPSRAMAISAVVTEFQRTIRSKKVVRADPDLSLVAHCIAEALALTPGELAAVTAGVRPGIAAKKFKVSVPYDASGTIDETKLPALPRLPKVAVHPPRTGAGVSERRIKRLIATCATLTPKELTLVTQGVREGLKQR